MGPEDWGVLFPAEKPRSSESCNVLGGRRSKEGVQQPRPQGFMFESVTYKPVEAWGRARGYTTRSIDGCIGDFKLLTG